MPRDPMNLSQMRKHAKEVLDNLEDDLLAQPITRNERIVAVLIPAAVLKRGPKEAFAWIVEELVPMMGDTNGALRQVKCLLARAVEPPEHVTSYVMEVEGLLWQAESLASLSKMINQGCLTHRARLYKDRILITNRMKHIVGVVHEDGSTQPPTRL